MRREKGLGERGGTYPSRRGVLEAGFFQQTKGENRPKKKENIRKYSWQNTIEILILNVEQDVEPSQTCEDEKKERVRREGKNLPELENDSGTGILLETDEDNKPKEREKTLENMIYKNRIEILTADCQIEPNLWGWEERKG